MPPRTPMNKIERAHQMYRDGRFEEALNFYTEALSMARSKPQKIALHSNRAACYLKLHDFKKAAEECTSVLVLDQKHAGALMLRAQTLVTLKEYSSALFDVNRLMEMDPSSEVYQNLQARLKTQLSLAPIPEAEAELEEDDLYIDGEQQEEEDKEEERKEDEEEGVGDEDEMYSLVGVTGSQINGSEGTAPRTEITITPQNLENGQKVITTPQNIDHCQKATTSPQDLVHGQKVITSTKDLVHGQKVITSTQDLVHGQKVITTPKTRNLKELPEHWEAIPKPKGHSRLDYSRWDKVEDDSSEDDDEDDDEEARPQYRFRVRTVGVRPVK